MLAAAEMDDEQSADDLKSLLDLPSPVLASVCSHMDARTLHQARLTCSRLRDSAARA